MSTTVLEQPGKAKSAANGSERKLHRRPVRYPESDGKPMAETPEHRDAMMYAITAARAALDGRADVWISGNDFVYYRMGEPSKRISPDCYIVLGVEQKRRQSYKVWEEDGHVPNVVFELTSPKTAKEDREEKFELYEQVLKVPEYFLFDPLNQYLKPRLQGYRLVNGSYQPIPFDTEGRLESKETGIKMFADGEILRFIHPRTDEVIRTSEEKDSAIIEKDNTIAARDQEIARLLAEVERLRKGNS